MALFVPDTTPCTESKSIDTRRKGTIEANSFSILGLLLKKLDQILCPNPNARRTTSVRRRDSLRDTNIALLALLELPAPSSFATLVLT